jgi:hypothetical protein
VYEVTADAIDGNGEPFRLPQGVTIEISRPPVTVTAAQAD